VDLGGLGVGGLLDLVLSSLGEANAEEAELVTVSGGAVNMGLDLGLPLLDDGALLVTGQLHTVEVGEASVTLDLLADETEFTVGGLVTVEISLVDLVDAAAETVSGKLGTGGAGDQSLADQTVLEDGWGLDFVPLLLGEWVDNLLLASLFTLGKALILANSHGDKLSPYYLLDNRNRTQKWDESDFDCLTDNKHG